MKRLSEAKTDPDGCAGGERKGTIKQKDRA